MNIAVTYSDHIYNNQLSQIEIDKECGVTDENQFPANELILEENYGKRSVHVVFHVFCTLSDQGAG